MAAADRAFAIRKALTHYLCTNPNACDSAAGIAFWWLPPELEATEMDLLPLLRELEQRGVLEKLVTADGHLFYRRAAAKARLRVPASLNQLH